MRIFVVGAGATGAFLAQLLERQGHAVQVGDRNPERARRFLPPSIPCLQANARNLWAVVRAAQGSHLLVSAVPAIFNQILLRAALRLRVHYLDMATHLGGNSFKAEQLRFHKRFVEKRRVALINAGIAPGLTNMLVARSADLLDAVEQAQIRLYESTDSKDPVSTWSAESAFDEAVSRPRIYRAGHFRLARRFSEAEWFRFPPPIGRARVVLAAQDEVGTLPYFIPMRDLDVKIGGNEIDRLRRWYRQGKLRPSVGLVARRFPITPTPRQVARLVRRGLLSNARFAAVVVVAGRKGEQRWLHNWLCVFPTLHQIRLKGILATPIAYATAHAAALFVKHLPRTSYGVCPPEALPAETRRRVVADMQTRGIRITFKATPLKPAEEDDEEL